MCILGDTPVQPDLLLWGDSHMLSWAPGFDAALKSLGRAAYFAPNSACPPIFDVEQSTDRLCRAQNDGIALAISGKENGGAKLSAVVLAGYWHKYFNDSDLKLSSDKYAGGNAMVAAPSFVETLERLKREGVGVIVLGGVPNYPVNVPYVVASGRGNGTKRNYADFQSTLEHQYLSTLPGFVDVTAWFCSTDCSVDDEGGVFYRDTNHLSPYGALRFQGKLAEMLSLQAQTRSVP